MQFHTENEILMYTYSYLHSRVFPTLLFMQYIPYCMTKLYITNDLINPASVMLCLRIVFSGEAQPLEQDSRVPTGRG